MKDMKLKHFFFAAILTAGITACSDDDNVVNNQDPTGVQAYMTLQIVGPQGADTRTDNTRRRPDRTRHCGGK